MGELICIKGFPAYHLETDTLKVISYHKSLLGKYRSMEFNDRGQHGYTLYNDGHKEWFSLEKLRGVVELHKLKGMVQNMNTGARASVGGPVKAGYWIVGSLSKASNTFSASANPALHTSLTNAKTEAARLAAADKTKKFVVLKVEALATVADVSWE